MTEGKCPLKSKFIRSKDWMALMRVATMGMSDIRFDVQGSVMLNSDGGRVFITGLERSKCTFDLKGTTGNLNYTLMNEYGQKIERSNGNNIRSDQLHIAISTLRPTYVQSKTEVFARHLTRGWRLNRTIHPLTTLS